jgi:hypothetical protein
MLDYLDERDAVAEAETLTAEELLMFDDAMCRSGYSRTFPLRAKLARMRGAR